MARKVVEDKTKEEKSEEVQTKISPSDLQVVNAINTKKKTTKITTLDKAVSFKLKRFFSGSFGADYITGGGFAYRRIQLLFGAKSSGKNALLNQTTAYLQRQCKHCHKIHPAYIDKNNRPVDYWTAMLKNVLGYGVCQCAKPEPKRVFVLDYERSLAIEEPRAVRVMKLTRKDTGEDVDELDYNDALALINEMKELGKLTDEQKESVKAKEAFIKNLDIKEQIIQQLATTEYLTKCGVIVNELLVADPEDTEEGIELVRDFIRSKEVDAIIWDSLQAAIPRYVKDRDADQATMGVEAKQNGLLMRNVCSAFAATDLTDESEAYKPALFITSQVRSTLGGFHVGPDSYSGGNAIQHHISLALEVKRDKFLREDGTEAAFEDNFYGQIVRIRADKNKLNAPGDMYWYNYYFREGEKFPIGIDNLQELAILAGEVGAVERGGSWYVVGDQKFQGIGKFMEYVRANPAFVRDLYIRTMNKL